MFSHHETGEHGCLTLSLPVAIAPASVIISKTLSGPIAFATIAVLRSMGNLSPCAQSLPMVIWAPPESIPLKSCLNNCRYSSSALSKHIAGDISAVTLSFLNRVKSSDRSRRNIYHQRESFLLEDEIYSPERTRVQCAISWRGPSGRFSRGLW